MSTNFYLSMTLLAFSGLCDGVSIYVRNTIYQLNTPDEMKGRVAAVNSIFIGSSNEIGEFESGVMARLMGTIPSVIFGPGDIARAHTCDEWTPLDEVEQASEILYGLASGA